MNDEIDEPFPECSCSLLRYSTYHRSHPYSYALIEGDGTRLHGGWGTRDVYFTVPDEDGDLERTLSSVYLSPEFDALRYNRGNTIEFLYGYLRQESSDGEILERSFEFIFGGDQYRCRFAEPSKHLLSLAKYVGILPGGGGEDQVVPQMRVYRDIARRDELPLRRQKMLSAFLEGRVPRSFYVG